MVGLIIIGAPGSGKGTQAKKIIEKYSLLHLATGDMLREELRNSTELGRKAKVFMDAGQLVPDEVIIGMIYNKLSTMDKEKGFILDGFPRTIQQAKSLNDMIAKLGIKLDKVLYLEVSLKSVVTRMAGRLTCTKCGNSYHKLFNPPKKNNTCDTDATELIVRDDDKEAVVIGRFNTYIEKTEPLLDFYKKKLVKIDGEQHIDKIFGDICKSFC